MADVSVDIDISDEHLLMLTRMAHERDITLNQMIVHILRKQMVKENPRRYITVAQLEEDFNEIIEYVEAGATYFINPAEGEEATMVLMPFEEYDAMQEDLS
jgi:hypothetical protein